MFLVSYFSIFFHSLVFRWEVPTPRPIRLSLFIQHVWVGVKLIADISPLTPLTFLLMPLRCVLFLPHPPQTNYPSSSHLPFSLLPEKRSFSRLLCVCVWVRKIESLGEKSSGHVKNCHASLLSLPILFYIFSFLKNLPRNCMCTLNPWSFSLSLFFIF